MKKLSQRGTVNKAIDDSLSVDMWEVSVSFDSRQFFLRFPKELADYLKIKKGQKAKILFDLKKKDKKEVTVRFLDEKSK